MQVMDQIMTGYERGNFKGRSVVVFIPVGQFRHKLLKFRACGMCKNLFGPHIGEGKQEYVCGNTMRFHEKPGDTSLGQGPFLPGAKQKQRSEMTSNYLCGTFDLFAGKSEPATNVCHHPAADGLMTFKTDMTITGPVYAQWFAYVV